jgi:hypothetical protein
MTARAAIGLATLFAATAAATMAFLAWRGQAMGLALEIWSLCF